MSSLKSCDKSSVHIVWFTGLSGSGKTTLALRLQKVFRDREKPVELLDGDVVRDFFENDLGYSRHERLLNIRRITFAAKLLADHGVNVIVANIAPYREVRDFIRRKLSSYIQVYCDASLSDVARRNTKGLYKNSDVTTGPVIGVDDVYEVPRNPDLILHTGSDSPDESWRQLETFLAMKGVL